MKHNYLFLCLICFLGALSCTQAQNYERIDTDSNNPLMGYYLKVEPASGQIDQVLFLMPGFSQRPESIFTESKLPMVASVNNTLTIAMAGGPTLFANDFTRHYIDLTIQQVLEAYPETKEVNWVMGGFSAGGTIALRFVELCEEIKGNCPVNFKGVFTVDSPVDLFAIWDYFEKELERNYSEIGMNEARFVMDRMTEQVGNPNEVPALYNELTPFKVEDGSDNEKYLLNVAVRVYHDVDIEWLLENRQRSAYDGNFLQSSEMIRRLIAAGHTGAEFIQADEEGYRSNGTRHPHSWSIVDEVELIQWMNEKCKTD